MDLEYIFKPGKSFPHVEEIGGKAYNLALLGESGFQIPPWLAIKTNAFIQFAQPVLQQANFNADALSASCLPDVEKERIRKVAATFLPDMEWVAVRSSAASEDGNEFSHAGQLSSFLFVRPDEIVDAMVNVWKSAFTNHALTYFQQAGVALEKIRVAVIIQKMVNPDSAGVAFAVNPVSGNRKQIVISAVHGLGESLVSGKVDADVYHVTDGRIDIISSGLQNEKLVPDSVNGGTKWIPLASHGDSQCILNDGQVLKIARLVTDISYHFSAWQDIEWAFEGDQLYLLQSRPITKLFTVPDSSQEEIIWDNSNIVESYPGIVSPLTCSFISDIYSEVYKQFCRLLGVTEKEIEENSEVFNMLGFINGRVYYNLKNWYNVLALLPGYDINRAFMEQMMGVKEPYTGKISLQPSDSHPWVRLFRLLAGLLFHFNRLPLTSSSFLDRLKLAFYPLRNIDFRKLSPAESMMVFKGLEKSLLKKWDAPLINDFFAMIFYGLLRKWIISWEIDSTGTLANKLLIGDGEIITTKAVKDLRLLTNKIIDNPDWMALFHQENDTLLYQSFNNFPELSNLIDDYISTYGIRWVAELKLETITPFENPQLMIPLLRQYVKLGRFDHEESRQREMKERNEAEAEVFGKIKGNFVKRVLLKFILNKTRLLVRNRENLRFERTRLFSMVRRIFSGMGIQLAFGKMLEHPRDIFYLTKEEVFGIIDGTGINHDLKKLVEIRKLSEKRYHEIQMPERLISQGTLYSTEFQYSKQVARSFEGDFQGIGCCSGIVKAPVRIVISPDQVSNLEGHILVAERTDPGWTPIFPVASGILVERGSLLSHSAIVAREMGIPAIVSIPGLIQNLSDGQWVEMDGTTGTIKLLEDQENASH